MRRRFALSMIMLVACATVVPAQAEPVKIVCTGSDSQTGTHATVTLQIDDAARTITVVDSDSDWKLDVLNEDKVQMHLDRDVEPPGLGRFVHYHDAISINRDTGEFFHEMDNLDPSYHSGNYVQLRGACTKAEQKF